MVFRAKREDTLVSTVEEKYGIDLHARGDSLLGNLLERRGFDSLTQLLQAYRGKLYYHARRRRLFPSFDMEDRMQVRGFELMARNPNVEFEMYNTGLREAVDSENSPYVRSVIRRYIQRASVVVCLIGNRTAWRAWVAWELQTAIDEGKGICGVRLRGSRGQVPRLLRELDAPIASWDTGAIIAAVESAAARRG